MSSVLESILILHMINVRRVTFFLTALGVPLRRPLGNAKGVERGSIIYCRIWEPTHP